MRFLGEATVLCCILGTLHSRNVVSESNRKYIVNLVAATAASKEEDKEDSSDESDAEKWQASPHTLGNLDLVYRTLDGISAQSQDNGDKGFGRYVTTIRLGRRMWQTDKLPEVVARTIEEDTMDDKGYPAAVELRKIVCARNRLQVEVAHMRLPVK